MRWLPRGTHDWRRFITPDELFALLRGAGLAPVDRKGFVFDPLGWSWRLSDRDLSVNYVTASLRPGPERHLAVRYRLCRADHGWAARARGLGRPEQRRAGERRRATEAAKTAILAAAKSPGRGRPGRR